MARTLGPPHNPYSKQGSTRLLKRDFLTMHRSTWAAPALVSSASRGPSSPFLVAVRSCSEYRWRSSVRWPGTVSKESRRLQEMRGSGWEQRMNTSCGTSELKDLYPEAGPGREGSQAEVMRRGNTQPTQVFQDTLTLPHYQGMDSRGDFYTLLQGDSYQLVKSGKPALDGITTDCSFQREGYRHSYCCRLLIYHFWNFLHDPPTLLFHITRANCWDMFLSKT